MSPASGLFTTGFMLWMSGSTLQIFSIMMIGMAFINPIKAIGGINATFQRFETTAKKNSPSSLSSSPAADASLAINTLYPKAIFLALQLVSLGIAVYKASSMGLLPLTSADWVSYIPMRQYAEHSAMHV